MPGFPEFAQKPGMLHVAQSLSMLVQIHRVF